MKTAEVICWYNPEDFIRRTLNWQWKGGHLIWFPFDMYRGHPLYRSHKAPWRLLGLYYSRKRNAVLCWRLDWITAPHDMRVTT